MPHTRISRKSTLLYAPAAAGRSAAEVLNLPPDEARHVRALRLEPGATVRLTDGRGRMWGARLGRSAGDSQSCVLVSELDAPPSLPVEVAFGVANKTHTLWLVEKATEMGVARLSPVEFARSRSVADAARPAAFWKKAGRRAVSAMKQSGGVWLPELEQVRDLQEFLPQSGREGTSSDPTPAVAAVRILLDQSAEPLGRVVSEWDGEPPITVLVGPEGGLTDAERVLVLSTGFTPARLTSSTLRFETAAVAAVAVIADHLETVRADLRPHSPRPGAQENLHER